MSGASQLPPARSVFYDANGAPLSGGFVYTYIQGSTTPAQTWQDANETIPNSNPVVLDANGSCLLYGNGAYQFTVTDALGNAVPAYSGLTYSPAYVSPALQSVLSASTVEDAFDLLAVNGGTIGASLDITGNLLVGNNATVNGELILTTPLPVPEGGTGANTLPSNSLLIGEGTLAVGGLAPGAADNIAVSTGTLWATQSLPSVAVTSLTGGLGISVSASSGPVTISTAFLALLAVGSYLWAQYFVPATPTPGTVYAGSTLYNPATNVSYGASGSWLCLGLDGPYIPGTGCPPTANVYPQALWQRVA